MLFADRALTDPKEDRLGYAPFASNLANSICKMTPAPGIVIAIQGSWGLGKTTVLNFVEYYIQQKESDERPIIVHFDPWWFSGREDLTKRFFHQIQTALVEQKTVQEAKRLGNFIADFANTITEIPYIEHVPFIGPFVPVIGGVVEHFHQSQRDLRDLKRKIENILKKQKKRILVVIDDIDRLAADETAQLFRVIKAIADFPNVTYLLAFDRIVVSDVLATELHMPGEAYLRKIIQVSLELPLPDRLALRRILFEKLDSILSGTPMEMFDQTYWGNVYLSGIDHFINTPRDVVLLTNATSATYPAVRGEVNAVDFIAIETIRVFRSGVYDIVRRNPNHFAGHTSGATGFSKDDAKRFHHSWLAEVPKTDQEVIKRLLLRLFPKLEAVWDNRLYGPEFESEWRKIRRVCSESLWPIYFRLTIPQGDISNAEMKSVLATTNDPNTFSSTLRQFASQKRPDGTTRLRLFLERFEDYTSETPTIQISNIIEALFNVGDDLLRAEDQPRGILDIGNDIRIGRIVWQLLRRLDEPTRFEILKTAISKAAGISVIVHELSMFGQEQGKYGAAASGPKESWLLTEEHLAELEKIGLERVRQDAKEGKLLPRSHLLNILYRWIDWSKDKQEVDDWVHNVTQDDAGLLVFLQKFVTQVFRQVWTDSVGTTDQVFDIESLKAFIDPTQIIERTRQLSKKNTLTAEQQTTYRLFIDAFDRKQNRGGRNDVGEPPDSGFRAFNPSS